MEVNMNKTWLKSFVVLALVIMLGSMTFAQNTVRFRVNMKVKILEGAFRPDLGDIVRLAGNCSNPQWGDSRDTLRDLAPLDSVYEKTIALPPDSNTQYKFLKTLRSGSDWEGGDNKTYRTGTGAQTLPLVFFDNDSVVSVPVSGNVTWRVDMRAMVSIGWFVAATDSVQVRGGFNGWNGTAMTLSATTGLYQVTLPYTGSSFDRVDNKFFMKLDSVGAAGRFPGFGTNKDGVQYDHPSTRGDGNRQQILPGTSGNITSDANYFSNIHRFGLMLNVADTSRVTLRVNMGPATRYIDPFVPASDTLYLQWQDQAWSFNQVANGGTTSSARLRLTRNGPTDSVWSVSFRVKGRSHHGLMYNYSYKHVGGGGVDEGGGLGVQNPYRSRYIGTTAPNVFPATYTAPLDAWQKNSPMPAENAPYGITDVRENEGVKGIPTAYSLNQNYPNPFNPSTRITYSIPENAKVMLKVFNLLGQEVAELVNQEQTKGNYIALFEANKLSSGVYFYTLEAGKFSETRKMLLMK